MRKQPSLLIVAKMKRLHLQKEIRYLRKFSRWQRCEVDDKYKGGNGVFSWYLN